MATMVKPVLGIIALIVVGAAIYFGMVWYGGSKSTTDTAVFSTESATLPSGTSTTDGSLAQDATAIDADLKALDTDRAAVDTHLNSTATTQ